jgi:undecaprenyl-diphosphatase
MLGIMLRQAYNKLMSSLLVHILADYLIVVVLAIGGLTLLLIRENRYQVWGRAVMAGLVALLFAKIISLLYHGQRPFETLGVKPGAAYLPDPGFPSDHALLVFSVVFIVWASTKNVRLSLTLLVLAVLVSLGRILALVHTPLDIAGGVVCAFLAAVCIYGRRFFTTAK